MRRAEERFDAAQVIVTKRDGGELSAAQIDWVVHGFVRGVVGDEQMAALAMAILLRGMTTTELDYWTAAMITTGEQLSYRGLGKPTADKHSTGGVGDKVTLPLAPLVASFGVAVPQLSGRGLGHTGGTLDKLEAIAGWRSSLTALELVNQLREVGCVVCSAGSELVPADRKLYALRDVTGTVESIPLIASSIMSKKIAEGTDALVLDVKCGSGAFMQDMASARELARTMVEIGRRAEVWTVALITDMSTPLGRTVGNALEVREAIEVLAGGGPEDVVDLTVALAREMLNGAAEVVRRGETSGEDFFSISPRALEDADPAEMLRSGKAMDTWRAMVRAQGGDPLAPLPVARETEVVRAINGGTLTRLDARAVGVAAWWLGGGRTRQDDVISHAAGVELHVKPGDRVVRGQAIATIHTDHPELIPQVLAPLEAAVEIGPPAVAVSRGKTVLERVW